MRQLPLPALLLGAPALDAQPPRPPAMDAIRATAIRRDIDILGGDHFRGREAGTLDETRASIWIADQLRAIGLEPAGEDGTFFQWWPMRRQRLGHASAIDDTAAVSVGLFAIARAWHTTRGRPAVDPAFKLER